jgi:asparagine synthetase B (glutamine-hydrolysing)
MERLGPRTVIDGTGADGLFGIGMSLARWKRAERVPRWVRRLIGSLYGPLDAWKRSSADSTIESAMRVFRRTTQMPLPLAVVSQNPLDGLAYRIPSGVREEIDGAIVTYILSMADDADEATTLSMIDMIQVCAGIFAAKSFDPLRMRGADVRYPFLEPDVLSLGCEWPWSMRCPGGVPKGMLRNLLRGVIPDTVLERPKTGFTPPFARMLAGDVWQEFIRGLVLSPHNPVIERCDASLVRKMADHVRRHQRISVGAMNYLWTLIFTSAWWRGTRPPGGTE